MAPATEPHLIIPVRVPSSEHPTGHFTLVPSASGHRVIFTRSKGLDNQPTYIDRLSLADLQRLREAIDAYLG